MAKQRKRESALDMKRSFENEMEGCIKLTQAYDHMVEHDNLDCSNVAWDSLSSWATIMCQFRRWGFTLISLTFWGTIFVMIYKC
jgi:hypothetical protein